MKSPKDRFKNGGSNLIRRLKMALPLSNYHYCNKLLLQALTSNYIKIVLMIYFAS